jgi:hypothetical protein
MFRPSISSIHTCNPPHASARLGHRHMEMNMKRELAVTGIALVVAILLSSPSIAQTTNAKPALAPVEAVTEAEPILSLDELVQADIAPEDRAKMLLRCIGPGPRPLHSTQAESQPASEPAVMANAPSPLRF